MTIAEGTPRNPNPEHARREGESAKDYLFRLTDNPKKEFVIDAGELFVTLARGTVVGILEDHVLWIMVNPKKPETKPWLVDPNSSSEVFGYLSKDEATCSIHVPFNKIKSLLEFEYQAFVQRPETDWIFYRITNATDVQAAMEGYATKIDELVRKPKAGNDWPEY